MIDDAMTRVRTAALRALQPPPRLPLSASVVVPATAPGLFNCVCWWVTLSGFPDEDATVDFSNASLYLSGIQSVFAICCCACVSVLSASASRTSSTRRSSTACAPARAPGTRRSCGGSCGRWTGRWGRRTWG